MKVMILHSALHTPTVLTPFDIFFDLLSVLSEIKNSVYFLILILIFGRTLKYKNLRKIINLELKRQNYLTTTTHFNS